MYDLILNFILNTCKVLDQKGLGVPVPVYQI